ncbi:hypothetical protein CYMTET_29610 [Cymbomonas tetramitiformis]|uniref:Uncharacterized protein n=1 Tax=Cymbomonas tetramitiformis TaxID=36881 RepID=A0AAE0FL20_9CHLO|nr:hypothetical protein CYMTET_29610 [Cymbomonas tetramitiformis]
MSNLTVQAKRQTSKDPFGSISCLKQTLCFKPNVCASMRATKGTERAVVAAANTTGLSKTETPSGGAPQSYQANFDEGQEAYKNEDYVAAGHFFVQAIQGKSSAWDETTASDLTAGETMACLHNLACCHARLGQIDEGFKVLEAAFRWGLGNWQKGGVAEAQATYERLQTCDDFAPLREEEERPTETVSKMNTLSLFAKAGGDTRMPLLLLDN